LFCVLFLAITVLAVEDGQSSNTEPPQRPTPTYRFPYEVTTPFANFNDDLLTALRNIWHNTKELDAKYEFLYNNFVFLQESYQTSPFSDKNDKEVTGFSSRVDGTQVVANKCKNKLVSIINRIPVNVASMQELRAVLSKANEDLVNIMNIILNNRKVLLTLKEALNTDTSDPQNETQANKRPIEDLIHDLFINNGKLKLKIQKKTFTEDVRKAIKLVRGKVGQK